MTITFFGHSELVYGDNIKADIINKLQKIVGNEPCEVYLGNIGNFDRIAYESCREYKKNHSNLFLVFVSPYLKISELDRKRFDETAYAPIEDKPIRFAISYRNRWVVENVDLIICYISHDWGGAYKACDYAKRKNKAIINLADQ